MGRLRPARFSSLFFISIFLMGRDGMFVCMEGQCYKRMGPARGEQKILKES